MFYVNYLSNIYFCSCYGFQVEKLAVCRIVNISYTTHTSRLRPNQAYISTQIIKRCIWFLFGIASSHNIIVYTCFKNAVGNAITPIGSNKAYFRNNCEIEVNSLSKNITNFSFRVKHKYRATYC